MNACSLKQYHFYSSHKYNNGCLSREVTDKSLLQRTTLNEKLFLRKNAFKLHSKNLKCSSSLTGKRNKREEKSRNSDFIRNIGIMNDTSKNSLLQDDLPQRNSSRSVVLTIHGIKHDEESLKSFEKQLLNIDGVNSTWIGPYKEGGMRGGSAMLQLDVSKNVSVAKLIEEVHSLEEDFLALPFKTNYWLWRGHKINYAVAGCGDPIILVHGFGGNAGHFRNLISLLSENNRVYAIDLLGFGDSDKPSHVPYGPDLWADLVKDFAEEFAGSPAILIGNSIGSLTVLTAAANSAGTNLFRGLVLLNCVGGMNRKGLEKDAFILKILSPIFIFIEFLLKKPKIATFLFEKFRSKENVKKILIQQVYRDTSVVNDKLVDILYHPSQHPGAVDVFVKVFTGNPGKRPEELLTQINNLPILVLWGDSDPWTPVNGNVALLFKQLEKSGKNVKFHVLPDVGHCPHDDRPQLTSETIAEWIKLL